MTADRRHPSTALSRSSGESMSKPGKSNVDITVVMSSSTHPADSDIAPSVVPLALMAIVLPSGDLTDVFPPPP